jgi:VWFA-related protein
VVVPRDRPTRPAPRVQEKVSERVNPDDTFRFTTEVDLVNLSVVVQDRNGNFIPELKKEHFRILEDGVPQQIQRIETSEAPMTVAMVIEFSDLYWEFLYQTLQTSYGFVSSLRPEDWVAIVVYDLKTQIMQDFTRNKASAFDALNQLRIPGFREMNLFDALTETIGRMDDIEGKKAIVLISSGVDTFSRTRYNDALKIVQSSDTPVYAIGTGQAVRLWYESRGYMGSETNIGFLQADNQLRSFARLSGGRAYFPRFEGQFGEIFGDISAALRNEYSISYSPTNTVKDGKFRKLKVEIVGPDGKALKIVDPKGKEIKYEVRNREGYYASRVVE